MFETKVRELDEALDLLDRMKTEARRLPIANPAPGPLDLQHLRRAQGSAARHAGACIPAWIFARRSASPARVTAAGTVVKAGWNGGYGRMVEVEHAGGFTTRYAPSEQDPGQGRPETRRRRRRRQGRQQRPLDRPASPLRGAPQWRCDRPAALPEGRQEGQPLPLISANLPSGEVGGCPISAPMPPGCPRTPPAAAARGRG